MNSILRKMECNPVIESGKYMYNGKVVPRVTEILASMLHEEYLMGWANYLGFKRKSYNDTLKAYAEVGTNVHNLIEIFLKTGNVNYDTIPASQLSQVSNGVQSFLHWYKTISKNTVSIMGIEDVLTCEWFGGTCDLLININGKTFLVDFKTSKNIGYKHFVQLSAYKYMYNQNNIHIDGVIILQLDKDSVKFTEHILVCENPEHMSFINSCTDTFIGLVYGYYNRLVVEERFKTIF